MHLGLYKIIIDRIIGAHVYPSEKDRERVKSMTVTYVWSEKK